MANFINTSYGYGNGGYTTNFSLLSMYMDNTYDKPISTIEKDNKKILQYVLTGFNEHYITVKKNFINKTKVLNITITGEFEDELTDYKNNANIKFDVDCNIYNKITWSIKDGLLTVILYEIINEEPEVELSKEIK